MEKGGAGPSGAGPSGATKAMGYGQEAHGVGVVAPGGPNNPVMGEWSSNICDCFQDAPSCCYVFACSPCVYADLMQRQSVLDQCGVTGHACMYYCLCTYVPSTLYIPTCFCVPCITQNTRRMLRNKYQLPEEPCNDCCTHFWCHSCALCQEFRELKYRGVSKHVTDTAPGGEPYVAQIATGYPADHQQGQPVTKPPQQHAVHGGKA
ncbi:unnamed protein product [Pedinophyceae sp. YPF-701]|nr:unnamed protein product [Pedinophyceae sp. YPF-701]